MRKVVQYNIAKSQICEATAKFKQLPLRTVRVDLQLHRLLRGPKNSRIYSRLRLKIYCGCSRLRNLLIAMVSLTSNSHVSHKWLVRCNKNF
jgi:redox-regulated HSP33 family molecular chaperone